MQYYRDTGEIFSDFKPNDKLVEEYMHKIETIQFENIIVDKHAILDRIWSCNPEKCTYNSNVDFDGTCCDGGGIISPKSETKLKKYLNNSKEYLDDTKKKLIDDGKLTLCKYKLNEINDECIFLAKRGRKRFCSLHQVAIDIGEKIEHVKPFDCCLSPLEIIILNDNTLFLTLATKDTQAFVRWRNYMGCVEEPITDSKPIYITLKKQLIELFGIKFYEFLKSNTQS